MANPTSGVSELDYLSCAHTHPDATDLSSCGRVDAEDTMMGSSGVLYLPTIALHE